MKLKKFFSGLVMLSSVQLSSAANNSITISDITGDPLDAMEPILGPIRWLMGNIIGWFFVASIASLFVCAGMAITGGMTNDPKLRNRGVTGVMWVVGIMFTVVIALIVYWFLWGKYIA